jgi:hypothetical protein
MEEVSAMVDARLSTGRAAEDLRFPCVKMAVEVDNADWAIGAIDGTKKRQRDSVVSTKSDHSRQGLTALRVETGLVGVGLGRAAEDAVVALLNLLNGKGIVITGIIGIFSFEVEAPTYDVTGISPQSMTFAQLLNGFALRGTLYPPILFRS